MKENKFRACISPETVIYFDLSDLIHPKRKGLFSMRELLIPWLLAGNKPDDYTGRKDKNGVEIWEGDIALCPEWEDYDKGIMGQVRRVIRWDNSDACFALFLKDEPDRGGNMLDNACNIEVIGNIYENPELLKEVSNDKT